MQTMSEIDQTILDMLEHTPGMTSQEITDALRAKGYSVGWEGIKRRMTKLRDKCGLRLQIINRERRIWFLPEDAPAKELNLKDAIVQIMRDIGEPITTVQICNRLRMKFNRPEESRRISTRMHQLHKSGVVRKLGFVSAKANRNMWELVEENVASAKPTNPTQANLNEFIQRGSPADDKLNQRTLDLVPKEHLPAIYEAAERMKRFRETDRVFGAVVITKKTACDYPIRAIFEDARDDIREVRYSALALWLSWRLDDHETEAA
jgi:hypothetical protein